MDSHFILKNTLGVKFAILVAILVEIAAISERILNHENRSALPCIVKHAP